MKRQLNIGDKIICLESGVVGRAIKFYTPTASEEQTMVETNDGRQYHAPTRTWTKVVDGKTTKGIYYGEYTILDATITDPQMLEIHIAYIEKFACNHGLTFEEALKQPMVKAHATFCAESHPDIFNKYMREAY